MRLSVFTEARGYASVIFCVRGFPCFCVSVLRSSCLHTRLASRCWSVGVKNRFSVILQIMKRTFHAGRGKVLSSRSRPPKVAVAVSIYLPTYINTYPQTYNNTFPVLRSSCFLYFCASVFTTVVVQLCLYGNAGFCKGPTSAGVSVRLRWGTQAVTITAPRWSLRSSIASSTGSGSGGPAANIAAHSVSDSAPRGGGAP